jgi:hypothetical protein
MKQAALMYGAWMAGVCSAALLAYWWWVNSMQEEEGDS